MTRHLQRDEAGPGWMLLGSLLIHGLALLVVTRLHFLPRPLPEEPVYYVDMVDLPVASPQTGIPAAPAAPAPAPLPQAEPAAPKLSLPVPAKTPPAAAEKMPEAESASELNERLSRLEREMEARRAAATLEAIRKKVAAGKMATGIPRGKGSEAGSDYGSFIQSRLKDALAATIAYQSRRPEMAVRLFIDRKGQLVRYVIEKSSRDKLFDDAVLRAIDRAGGTFPPPPAGTDFEKLFVFSPEEVIKK